ncbi:MAG: hypothetical protein Q9219_002671 [cf. Caloplaca sp. 3 TL-2023]
MRLHLTIQRNALPPVRILWVTGVLGLPSPAAETEPTISQLLDQINDVIPLESGEWGLEDYTVEVRGFECLHFLEASQVLKEGDEVCIRPLSTSDLRCRKLSGRHQISADGKHLIDGIAFGRPFLRRANRPAIQIPPRKRRRLTYGDNSDDEDYESQRQIVVHPGFEGEEGSAAGSDRNGDNSTGSEDESDLDVELDDILRDKVPDANGDRYVHSTTERRRPLPTGLGLKLQQLAYSVLRDENGVPFPEKYQNPRIDTAKDWGLAGKSSKTAIRPGQGASSKRKRQVDDSESSPDGNSKSVHFNEAELTTPATTRLEPSDDSGDDDDFKPADDSNSDTDHTADSEKENAKPGSQGFIENDDAVFESDSSSSSESESEATETSSSGSSSSSSDSSEDEDKPLHHDKTPPKQTDADSTSSSGESTSSDSSSAPAREQPQQRSQKLAKAALSPAAGKIVQGSLEPDHENLQGTKAPVPFGDGQKRTQKRNQRRKDSKRLLRLQRAGILPENATTADVRKLDAPGETFEAKRQALLKAISSGGVDQEDKLEDQAASPPGHAKSLSQAEESRKPGGKRNAVEKTGSSASEKTLVDVGIATQTAVVDDKSPAGEPMDWPNALESSAGLDRVAEHADAVADISQLANETPLPAQKPRAKLDKDTSRRLVFGALGLRTPKTKEDETKLREKLMTDAEGSRKSKVQAGGSEDAANHVLPPEEDDSWKDKIELSAVECCHDDIKLSTPPFPFVQRWDPQQRKGYFDQKPANSRNAKKRKRNNKNYEASFEPLADNRAIKRQQVPDYGEFGSYVSKINFEDKDEAVASELQQDDTHRTSDDNHQAVNDQLLRETEVAYEGMAEESKTAEDMPRLPEDLSTCTSLERDACTVGAIIGFKQLDMSSETNWQPRISDYRTALIEASLEDGTLSLRTAPQDRLSSKKQYHHETGERLYSKFEMPGYDEETEGNDGLLELAFVDLIEPKLVKASEQRLGSGSGSKQPLDAVPDSTEETSKDETQLPGGAHGSEHVANASPNVHRDAHQPPRDDAEVSEQVRKEINDLIKDAGWRSSIQSNRSVQHEKLDVSQQGPVHESAEDFQTMFDDDKLSPRFDGFSSSPLAENFQEAQEEVIYPTLKGLSSPAAHLDGMADDPDQTIIDSSEQADGKAIHALREDFKKELDRPIVASTSDHHPSSPPKPGSSFPPSEASQLMDTPPLADSLKSIIPDSQPVDLAMGPASLNGHAAASSHRDSNSDSDFPSLETVFTTFSSQRDVIKDELEDSDGAEVLAPPLQKKNKIANKGYDNDKSNHRRQTATSANDTAHEKENKPPSSTAPPSIPARGPKSKPSPTKSSVGKSKKKSEKRLGLLPNRYEPAPRSSQDWIGTQVVDLTLSSDPVDATVMMEEEVGFGTGGGGGGGGGGGDSLPKGPGWVKKSKMGRTKAR